MFLCFLFTHFYTFRLNITFFLLSFRMNSFHCIFILKFNTKTMGRYLCTLLCLKTSFTFFKFIKPKYSGRPISPNVFMFSLSPHVFFPLSIPKNIFYQFFKFIKPKYSGRPIFPNVFMFSLSPHVFFPLSITKNIFYQFFKFIKPKYSGRPIFPNVFMFSCFSLSPHVFIFFKYSKCLIY